MNLHMPQVSTIKDSCFYCRLVFILVEQILNVDAENSVLHVT